MIIQALPQFANQTINNSVTGELKLNEQCQIEVKDSVGKKLLEMYPSILFDPNVEVVKEETPGEKYDKEVFERLNSKVGLLEEQVKEYKSQKKQAENDTQVWKDKVEELNKTIEDLNLQLETEKATTQKVIEDCEVKVSLYKLTDTKLKKICVDAKYPESEWTELTSDKDKLIDYLLNKK